MLFHGHSVSWNAIILQIGRNDLTTDHYFYVLLTVHLGIIFVNNQLDARFFSMYVYIYSLHVSDSHVPIIRRINCINTKSGICHYV
jgi:hypothetical protein